MADNQVTMTRLRQQLGDLVNRAAYGQERIVLVSRGEPRAAIISIADLNRLRELDATTENDRPGKALDAAAAVRENIRAWQEANGLVAGDVISDLNKLREERDAEIGDMR